MPAKRKSPDDWEKIWNARLKGLTQVLGKSENNPTLKQRGIFPYTIFDRESVLKRNSK